MEKYYSPSNENECEEKHKEVKVMSFDIILDHQEKCVHYNHRLAGSFSSKDVSCINLIHNFREFIGNSISNNNITQMLKLRKRMYDLITHKLCGITQ